MPYFPDKDQMEQFRWYAIRVTYSRELIVQKQLTQAGFETYIPMQQVDRVYAGVKRRVLVPAIHNLIFIRITDESMRDLKASTTLPIRYIMDRGTNTPVVIPDKEMEDFKAVIEAASDHVEIVEANLPQLRTGMRVRIIEGIFKGVEGTYLRYKGHSKVAVCLTGIATALTAYVPSRFVKATE